MTLHLIRNTSACCKVLLAATLALTFASAVNAAEVMPVSQQNALVQKYCAVCHTDTAKNGGLSLQHFNAANAAPSLTAMLLSKLSGGVSLEMLTEVGTKTSAAALVDRKMRSGAMGAAGIPIPDKATIDALIHAFTVQSAGATNWSVERTKDGLHGGTELTASILRESTSARNAGEAEFYRLIAACNPATKDGYVQIAWSPVAQSGMLFASVDGNAPVQYPVEGSEAMGNSSGVVLHGLAALLLSEAQRGVARRSLPFPANSITISQLFPGETVSFSFKDLPVDAREQLQACFPGEPSSR